MDPKGVNAFEMDPQRVASLWGIPLVASTYAECIEQILTHREGGVVHFVNVHTLMEAEKNPKLREAFLAPKALNFPDGKPLVWLLRKASSALSERLCGPDVMHDILRKAPEAPMAILGATPEILSALQHKYNLTQCAFLCPPYRPFSEASAQEDWNALLQAMPAGLRPRWVWVALGAPKQELWMHTVAQQAPDVRFFGIGAAVDFLSGVKPRAPEWMQKSGLEWAFRLASEPRRLGGRYFSTNARFLWKCIRGQKA